MSVNIRNYKSFRPKIGKAVYIDPQAAVIGQVELEDDVSIWPFACARGDVNQIHIGRRTNVQDGAVLHVTHDGPYSPGGKALLIGQGVTIGHKAVLHACNIGDHCLIGISAVVLDGAELAPLVMLGAGSLVPPGKHLESKHLYLGNPVRKVRALTDKELEFLKYSAEHYIKIKNAYLS